MSTIEVLADIVAKQARVIATLSNLLAQHNAFTSVDDEVEELQKRVKEYIGSVY